MPLDRANLLTRSGNWYRHIHEVVGVENLSLGEWNEALEFSTLAHKWPEQLGHIHRTGVQRQKRLEQHIALLTEAPAYAARRLMEDVGMTQAEAQAAIAARLERHRRKLAKARLNVELCEAEMAIRASLTLPDTPAKYRAAGAPLAASKYRFDIRGQRITRQPLGTTYYLDADSGNNANTGLSVAQAWQTYAQAMETTTRAAGDIIIARRRCTGRYDAADAAIGFDEDGAVNLPLVLTADYANAFSTDVDISVTATATLTFGSTTVTFTNDVSSVIAAGDWLYVSGDTAEDHCMYVDSVSTTTVTLALPYNGLNEGSGRTVINMGSNPIYGTTTQSLSQFDFDNRFLKVSGHHQRTNDGSGIIIANNSFHGVLKNIIAESGVGTRGAIGFAGGNLEAHNFIGIGTGIFFNLASSIGGTLRAKRAKAPSSTTIHLSMVVTATSIVDVEDADFSASTGDVLDRSTIEMQTNIRLRNCKFNGSSNIVDAFTPGIPRGLHIEDFNNTPGDTRQYSCIDATDNQILLQSEGTEVRSGGSATSIKVLPATNLNKDFEPALLRIFEQVHYLPASATTLSVYIKPDDTADWTASPTAAEFWLEVEAWGHASNNYRKLVKSTGTVDMTSATWQGLSVSITPAQIDRSARVRLWYGKPKEAAKSNIFYVDPLVVRS